MDIPTKAELNGRALYILIDPAEDVPRSERIEIHQSPDGLTAYARERGLVLVQGFIAYDGREAGQE